MRAVDCRAGTHPQRRLVRGVEALRDGGYLEPDDVGEHRLAQRVEHDDLVEPIQELGPELGAHRVQDLALDLRELGGAVGVAGGVDLRGRLSRRVACSFPGRSRGRARPQACREEGVSNAGGDDGKVRDGVEDELRPDVGREEDDGVAEVDRLTLAVGQDAVVEQLEHEVEDVPMRLLHLVEEHHRVGSPPHGVRQLAALLEAHVARRGADELGHGVLLHVLGHVEAHDGFLRVEHVRGEGLADLGLAHARRAEEGEAGDGLRGPPGRPWTVDRVGDEVHGGWLADDALRERLLEMKQLVALRGHQPRGRDARPGGDDGRDVVGVTVSRATRLSAAPPSSAAPAAASRSSSAGTSV